VRVGLVQKKTSGGTHASRAPSDQPGALHPQYFLGQSSSTSLSDSTRVLSLVVVVLALAVVVVVGGGGGVGGASY
jgi:hypothetical protein